MKKFYKAPAKINLGLQVLRTRADGFHDISSAMITVDWHDEISIEPATELGFSASGFADGIDVDENLCTQAARLIMERYDKAGPVSIHLDKQIPIGAGLGGGSSDAACVLNAMNDIWDLEASLLELKEMASILGSDVPFFIECIPALAEGRGEKLTAIEIPSLGNGLFDLCVCMPRDEFVSTAEAYGNLIPQSQGRPEIRELLKASPSDWRGDLQNDFEKSVGERHPRILEVKNWMYENDALYASMTGSGAAVFGVFEKGKSKELESSLAQFSDRFVTCPF